MCSQYILFKHCLVAFRNVWNNFLLHLWEVLIFHWRKTIIFGLKHLWYLVSITKISWWNLSHCSSLISWKWECNGITFFVAQFNFLNHYCIPLHHHHHPHHVVPPAQISLTLSRHFSLSFIASGRSSGLHPVSSRSCCMYVLSDRPALARPYVGVHRSTSLMSPSLLLQQYPVCLVRLTWIVFVMGGRWPYSWCFVGNEVFC